MMNITVDKRGTGRDGREADQRLWTLGRVAGWVAATSAVIAVAGVAMGLLAARLDHGTGAHPWRERILLAVPLVVTAIIGGAALLALRRSWPRRPGPDAGEWQHRAAARARRTATVWMGAVAAIAITAIAVPTAAWAGTDTPAGIGLLAIGLVTGVVGLVWGTVRYMRVIDDHERRANLYCGYAGLSTYVILFFVQMLARKVIDLPRMDDAIFLVTSLVAGITFCIVRFR